MIKFLIQIDNDVGIPQYDFCYELVKAVEYQNWYYDNNEYDYYLTNDMLEYDYHDYIPIGSVEFVLNFYKQYYNIDDIKPINIPQELMNRKYTKRWIDIIKIDSNNTIIIKYSRNSPMFIKDNTKIKGIAEIFNPVRIYPQKEYLMSDVIDINSEWRAFVFNKKLVGLQNYSGDFTMFPDINLINEMIEEYKSSPRAYTLDVGINKDETFLIEVHQFFSCGLYGFNDYRVLPQMFISTHKEIISK